MTSTTQKYSPETYTPEEEKKLKEFRERISDLEVTDLEDPYLIRWLRARNLDIPKAYDMLKASLEWRKENNLDGILEREQIPLDYQQQLPGAYIGVDKEGYPIFLVPGGRQDIRAVLEKYGVETCFRYHLIFLERVCKLFQDAGKEQGRPVTQFVQILDASGYNYRQFTSKVCREYMTKMQTAMDSNYPELLRYCIVINAPKMFYLLFKIFKSIIPKKTLEKIEIYGPDQEVWKKVLAERFPMELIPPYWGGTRKGSDEYCFNEDIWLHKPKSIDFFTDHKSGSGNDEELANLTTSTVAARDSLKITLTVKVPNSSITWKFRTQSHDIGFQILYENDGSELVPYKRVQAQKKTFTEDSQQCDRLGNYTVVFDNKYSYVRSKTVSYKVEVVEETEEIDLEIEEDAEAAEEIIPVLKLDEIDQKEVQNNNDAHSQLVNGNGTANHK